MKAAPFEYLRAASLDEACAALARHGPDAKLIAGGQSLVPMMAMRLVRPAVLVDIHRVEALRGIRIADGHASIGACARQCEIERHPELRQRVPLLAKALAWVGHQQTRNRGTVGGSIAHADPSAEIPLVVVTLGGRMSVRSATATRDIAASAFFTGPMSTALAIEECLTNVHLPIWAETRIGTAFDEVAIRRGDFALVAVAVQIALDADGRCTRAALGVGGAAGHPVAFPDLAARLQSSMLDQVAIEAVAAEAARRLDPMNDLHASADYRRHLAAGLLTRALTAARDEALAR